MATHWDVTSGFLGGTLSAWRGAQSFAPARKRPEKLLQLYDMENCPYCRLVREVLTELDLDAEIRPCPKDGTRFRPQAKALGGKKLFPFLVDPNTGTQLYESADIIEYLSRSYQRRVRSMRPIALAGSFLMSGLRSNKGIRARPSKAPERPLELFSFEASPYSRPVRELLCELEIPYVLRNTGKGAWTDMGPESFRDKLFKARKDTGRNRKILLERTGRVQVPYLIDPNTGTEMYESTDIVAYLEKTYAA